MNKITLVVSNYFHYLNVSNNWNTTSKHRHDMAKEKGPCNYCGGEHYSTDCPHPRDEAKIKNYKEECVACRDGGGRNGGCYCGRGGIRQGDHKKWINNKRDGDRNDDGNGFQKRGNSWMCYCSHKECG